MISKVQTKKKIQKDIEKFLKQETAIIKVLDLINGQNKQELFDQKDNELDQQLDAVKKSFDKKKKRADNLKQMKDNIYDFDYYIENAYFWSNQFILQIAKF